MRSITIQTSPGLCVAAMTNWLDPGIDRGALKTSRRNALCMPGIHLSIHVLSGDPIDWLSSQAPSQAETEAAVSEDRRADQEQDQRGVAPSGGDRAQGVRALGSRFDCGGGPPAWAECLGRWQKSPDAYTFSWIQNSGGNQKSHASSIENLSRLTHTIHDL